MTQRRDRRLRIARNLVKRKVNQAGWVANDMQAPRRWWLGWAASIRGRPWQAAFSVGVDYEISVLDRVL